ncbi:MAG: PAS domain-containing protein [Planctomycetes bacterium]|nr:PAS domain-containing protein [Planctomycetota bacterium]
MPRPTPTGVERFLDDDELIVSKTDVQGRITYANSVFLRIAGYTEREVLGAPHSIVRHPDMPRCVFKLLWDTIQDGREIFAYVKNLAKNGDHYWVFAHVTPSFDASGKIVGYHSNRRAPERTALAKIEPVYEALLRVEAQSGNHREAIERSTAVLVKQLESLGLAYEEFVFTL